MRFQQFGINITPYIDILLVLLIIFMVIHPQTRHSLDTRAPDQPNEASPPSTPTYEIVVSIDSNSELAINGQKTAFPQLGERVFEILKARADKRIFVAGAPDLAYGSVVKVIDSCKGAGAEEIGLMLYGTSPSL